jgi:hypothetical protein
MKATFLLFPHGGEQEARMTELGERLHAIDAATLGDRLLLHPLSVPASLDWPQAHRVMTQGIDPDLIIRAVYAVQWDHPIRVVYRTDEDGTWSFLTVEWKEPESWTTSEQ